MIGRDAHDAALYILNCLAGAEACAFEDHLRVCPRCAAEWDGLRRVASALALLAPAADPPPNLKQRLLDRIASEPAAAESAGGRPAQAWKNWAASASGRWPLVVSAADGEWQPTGVEGVSAKPLFVDPEEDRVTMLVRMEPGATYPAHLHGGAEESFILEGDLSDGEVSLRAGDYLRKDGGTVHEAQSSDTGCFMLIVSSLHDEIVPDSPRV